MDQAEIITSIWKRRKEKKQIRWKEKAKRIINDTIKRFGVECERSLPQKSKRDSRPIKYGSYSDKDSGSIDLFSYKYEALTKNNQHTSYSQEVTKKENKMECFSESEFEDYTFEQKSVLLRDNIRKNKELTQNLKECFNKVEDIVENLADRIQTLEEYNQELLKFKMALKKSNRMKTRSRDNKKKNGSLATSSNNRNRGSMLRVAKCIYFDYEEDYSNVIQNQINKIKYNKNKSKKNEKENTK